MDPNFVAKDIISANENLYGNFVTELLRKYIKTPLQKKITYKQILF
jgi:hypothetical protein